MRTKNRSIAAPQRTTAPNPKSGNRKSHEPSTAGRREQRLKARPPARFSSLRSEETVNQQQVPLGNTLLAQRCPFSGNSYFWRTTCQKHGRDGLNAISHPERGRGRNVSFCATTRALRTPSDPVQAQESKAFGRARACMKAMARATNGGRCRPAPSKMAQASSAAHCKKAHERARACMTA